MLASYLLRQKSVPVQQLGVTFNDKLAMISLIYPFSIA